MDREYASFGRLTNSAFVPLEAFEEMRNGAAPPTVTAVAWPAFPKTAAADFRRMDSQRAPFQDEYVEWRAEGGSAGGGAGWRARRVTFTMEFPEYWEALAAMGVGPLTDGIRAVIPNANPTTAELFGPSFDPATAGTTARASQFRFHLPRNPWNNGAKGILCLIQQFNTMGALFNLVGVCGIEMAALEPAAVCGAVGGACGDGRNSDPRISLAVQNLARRKNGLSLADPVGIQINNLGGIWKVDGQEVDINDAAANRGVWTVSRNGRRGVLDLTRGQVTLNDPAVPPVRRCPPCWR